MSPEFKKTELFEVLQYLYRNKISITLTVFSVAVITAIVTLFIPNQYKSTANLLPNQQRSVGFGLLSEGNGLSSIASSVLGKSDDEINRFYTLLNSYTTKKRVVEEFDLINVYELSDSNYPMMDAIGILESRTQFADHREGNFTIEIWDKDPVRSQEMAQFYVDFLNELNVQIATKEAKQFREFIEQRYQNSLTDLEELRNELKVFQENHGIFQLEEQVIQYFNIIGAITQVQVEKEIQRDYLKRTVSDDNQMLRQSNIELETINNRLNSIYQDSVKNNILLNFNDLAELGLQYAELTKKIEYQVEIQKFVLPLLEQAKMEEIKSLPVVSILDTPIVPEKKGFPPRTVIVLLSALTAFILCCCYFTIHLTFKNNAAWFKSLKS